VFRFLIQSTAAWSRRLAVLLLATLILALPASSSAEPKTEEKLKVEFLYRFVKFVSWPHAALPPLSEPMVFCVVGGDSLHALLDDLMQDRQLKDRDIVVRRLDSPESLGACHVLFAGANTDEQVLPILQEAKGYSILTVGESAAFYTGGGIIRFVLSGGRLRFDVNSEAAANANLRISSQLLKLARTVDR